MRLRNLWIAGILATASQPALAERWFSVAGDAAGQVYVDADSIRIEGNRRHARYMSRSAEPMINDVYAGAIVAEFDCANNWLRTLEYSFYGANREHLGTEPSETANEHVVPAPGSYNEGVFAFVCFDRGGTPVLDPWVHAEQVLNPDGKAK